MGTSIQQLVVKLEDLLESLILTLSCLNLNTNHHPLLRRLTSSKNMKSIIMMKKTKETKKRQLEIIEPTNSKKILMKTKCT